MGKFKEALRDLKAAARKAPRDPDLRKKLAECEKEVKRLKFEEALSSGTGGAVTEVSPTLDLHTILVDESYKGALQGGCSHPGGCSACYCPGLPAWRGVSPGGLDARHFHLGRRR